MKILKALLAGVAGTTGMSIFSYGISNLKKRQFREPVLLAQLIEGPEGPRKKGGMAKGWLAHYLVGAVFSLSYQRFLQGKLIRDPISKGLMAGSLYGIFLGVPGWKTAFLLHPQPPRISFPAYGRHLLFAHMVFGTIAFGLLEWKAKKEENKTRDGQ